MTFTHECQDCKQFLVAQTCFATNLNGSPFCERRPGEYHRPVLIDWGKVDA
jgi:hypothetical protein